MYQAVTVFVLKQTMALMIGDWLLDGAAGQLSLRSGAFPPRRVLSIFN
jgi:hypothetical protein